MARGEDGCPNITLPDSTVWAEPGDYGRHYWRANDGQIPTRATIRENTQQVNFPIYWTADRRNIEPNEAFCITLLNLPRDLKWKNLNSTALRVTIQNDDPNP